MQQLVELERLGDEVRRAALDGFDRVLHRAVAGDDDGDDVRVALERGVDDLRGPSMPGSRRSVMRMSKANVRQALERLLAAVGLLDHEAAIGQPLGDRLAQRRLVVDEEQMFRAVSHLCGRQYFDTPAGSSVNAADLRDGLQRAPVARSDNCLRNGRSRRTPTTR